MTFQTPACFDAFIIHPESDELPSIEETLGLDEDEEEGEAVAFGHAHHKGEKQEEEAKESYNLCLENKTHEERHNFCAKKFSNKAAIHFCD